MRWQAFVRAGGRCERWATAEIRFERIPNVDYVDFECQLIPNRCNASAPWDGSVFTRGHLAHKKHGPRKSDTLDEVIWSCADDHFAEHGLRWSKRMPKPMEAKIFEVYYHELTACVCGALKPTDSAMCDGCREWMQAQQPAILHIIQNGTGDPLLQAMAEFREFVRKAE